MPTLCFCDGVASLLPFFFFIIRCVRGSCSSSGNFCRPVLASSVELVQAETGLTSLVLQLNVCMCNYIYEVLGKICNYTHAH